MKECRFYKLISSNRNLEELQKWIITNIIKKEISIDNHEDIQILSPEGTKGYLTEQLSPMFKFLSMNPIELDKQLVIFDHPELLSEKIQNKLLKTLEEPHKTDIIFYAEEGTNFLPTVESRAISKKIGTRNFTNVTQSEETIKRSLIKTLLDSKIKSLEIVSRILTNEVGNITLVDYLKKNPQFEREFVKNYYELLNSINLNFKQRDDIIQSFKIYQEGLIYGIPLVSRISIILSAIQF